MAQQQRHPAPGPRTPNPVQVQKYLGGIDYPAGKEDIVKRAHAEGADKTVMDALERIPDQEYSSPTAVSKALGQLH
ncbi:MAG: hypothetical protein H6R10_3263 [Rhodocyclaceae bacterium]|nr:hypothetical protein [Rhodocyclaceae bacterium]